ncbi:MAG TPA: zinc metalloprotease HtpX [Nitrososphaeraceae archaeon]
MNADNRLFNYKRDPSMSLRLIFCFIALSALYAIFIGVLTYLGVGFIPIALMVSAMLLAQWYFSDKMVLWFSGAKVVSREQFPQLHEIVEKLVQRSNLPKPKVAVVNTRMPNAFATGKSHKSSLIAVTTGLLDTLDYDELQAVIAHELSHIKSRDVLVLTLASLFSIVASFLMRYALFGAMFGGGYGGRSRNNAGASMLIIVLVAVATWIISFIIIRAISRYREFAADRGSAQITGKPMELASALTKISGSMRQVPPQQHQRFQSLNAFFIIPALSSNTLVNLFSTHPPLEKRIQKLKEMSPSTTNYFI